MAEFLPESSCQTLSIQRTSVSPSAQLIERGENKCLWEKQIRKSMQSTWKPKSTEHILPFLSLHSLDYFWIFTQKDASLTRSGRTIFGAPSVTNFPVPELFEIKKSPILQRRSNWVGFWGRTAPLINKPWHACTRVCICLLFCSVTSTESKKQQSVTQTACRLEDAGMDLYCRTVLNHCLVFGRRVTNLPAEVSTYENSVCVCVSNFIRKIWTDWNAWEGNLKHRLLLIVLISQHLDAYVQHGGKIKWFAT